MDMIQEKLLSFLGMIVFIALAWALSQNRKLFPWRTVIWGMGLQFTVAILILRTPFGAAIFDFAQRGVTKLNFFANEGAKMAFGPLANGALLEKQFGPGNAFIFAIFIAATVMLISAISSLFYHWGILQRVVHAIARVMQRTMRTSGSESLAAAANVFVGQTEAPLLIKPYIAGMTRSEIMAMMAGGMATIGGGVLAAYAGFGISAGHLLTASVMNAPASLVIAKIMLPETETSETGSSATLKVEKSSINSIDALCRGASEGLMLALNVIAMVIVFVAVVGLANFLLSFPQRKLGIVDPVSFQTMVGWVNAPFAWLMGIPAKDVMPVGKILGERVVLNELMGYLSLTAQKTNLSPRSFVIATYALCGFANFGSVAIQIGGIGTLAPNRRNDLARLGLRAMVAGLLACYLTATIIGILL